MAILSSSGNKSMAFFCGTEVSPCHKKKTFFFLVSSRKNIAICREKISYYWESRIPNLSYPTDNETFTLKLYLNDTIVLDAADRSH